MRQLFLIEKPLRGLSYGFPVCCPMHGVHVAAAYWEKGALVYFARRPGDRVIVWRAAPAIPRTAWTVRRFWASMLSECIRLTHWILYSFLAGFIVAINAHNLMPAGYTLAAWGLILGWRSIAAPWKSFEVRLPPLGFGSFSAVTAQYAQIMLDQQQSSDHEIETTTPHATDAKKFH